MPKRLNNIFYAKLKFKNMLEAFERASKGKHKNKEVYVLKCDIKGFFYSIDKDILYELIKRKVKDKDFLYLTQMFIYNNMEKKGIPIGNYTSQYYANIYLNELDHYIKEELKIRYYVRYMDDFVLLLENKKECKEMLTKIRKYLEEKLKLQLNDKTNYFKSSQGIVFCGYKVFKEYITLKKENKRKIRKKVKTWNKIYENKNTNMSKANISLNAWLGHAINADTYRLRKKVIGDCKWIYREN